MSCEARIGSIPIPSARIGEIMDPPSETELAYIAGIIDGEGSITLQRNKGERNIARPLIAVDSTDRELIDWLHLRLGGSRVTKKKYADHHRQAYTWRLKDNRALVLLRLTLPYMVIERKRRRALMLVEEYRALTPANGRYTPELIVAKLAFIDRFLEG